MDGISVLQTPAREQLVLSFPGRQMEIIRGMSIRTGKFGGRSTLCGWLGLANSVRGGI